MLVGAYILLYVHLEHYTSQLFVSYSVAEELSVVLGLFVFQLD